MIISSNIVNVEKNSTRYKKNCIFAPRKGRDVAQPGSALRSGRRGRKFESCHPDQQKKPLDSSGFFFYFTLFCLDIKSYMENISVLNFVILAFNRQLSGFLAFQF